MKKKNRFLSFAIFTSLTLFGMFLINKCIFMTAQMKDLISNKSGYRYDWRFGSIFYSKHGTGKPLLLIHDLNNGSSSHEWKHIIEEYSKTNTVYAIDLLGCGKSDKPKITYTNFLYVQLISDFIKNVIGQRTDIVATGASCSFITMACFQDNTLMNKIMYINPQSLGICSQLPSHKSKILKLLIECPIIGTLLYNNCCSRKNYEKLCKEYYYLDSNKVSYKLIDSYYEGAHTFGTSSKFLYASIIGNYTNNTITHALKCINNSIYILGSSNISSSYEDINEMCNINPSIECAFLNEVKYLPQLENPSLVLDQMRIFF